MIQIAQGWQLAVERGPGWLFVHPVNLFQPDDGLSQPDDGLSGPEIGLTGPQIAAVGEIPLDGGSLDAPIWIWPSKFGSCSSKTSRGGSCSNSIRSAV